MSLAVAATSSVSADVVTSLVAIVATALSLVALIPQLLRVRHTTEGVSRGSYVLWAMSMVWWGLFNVSVHGWAGLASNGIQLALLVYILRYLEPGRVVVAQLVASIAVGAVLVALGEGQWALVGAAATTAATGWPQLRLALGHPHHLAGVSVWTWIQYAVGLLFWALYEWRIHQPVAVAINIAAAVPAVLVAIRVHQANRYDT